MSGDVSIINFLSVGAHPSRKTHASRLIEGNTRAPGDAPLNLAIRCGRKRRDIMLRSLEKGCK